METIKRLWTKYKEYILYLVFGGLTTLVSWLSFYLCTHVIVMDVVPANVISWILAVAFAYVTNRKWVFESRARGGRKILREAAEFTAGRVLTLVIETAFLWFTVEVIGWNDLLMKVIISIVVVILNYVISKLFVFRK